jgi:hypothetical protein
MTHYVLPNVSFDLAGQVALVTGGDLRTRLALR